MIAKEGGHWYAMDGTPAYTQPNKSKGGERPTTIRDARKHNLLPSVTTILKVKSSPGLERWKLNQVAMAALTLPPVDGESADDFLRRVWDDANEHSKQAREAGTAFHGELEHWFSGNPERCERADLCRKVEDALNELGFHAPWGVEKSFASPLGFGGKVDLHNPSVVADFKTKDKLKGKLGYDEQLMQLAAYRKGLGLDCKTAVNVFIGLQDEQVECVVWDEKDLERGWQMFHCLLNFWKLANNFEV